jgi:hypothetical protein
VARGFVLSPCVVGSITFVFAPDPWQARKMLQAPKIRLQNYGAKDMVHNNVVSLVFAT